jgi:hypothetical protein
LLLSRDFYHVQDAGSEVIGSVLKDIAKRGDPGKDRLKNDIIFNRLEGLVAHFEEFGRGCFGLDILLSGGLALFALVLLDGDILCGAVEGDGASELRDVLVVLKADLAHEVVARERMVREVAHV